MKTLLLGLAAVGSMAILIAQTSAPPVNRTGKSGEVRLVGVSLYDTGKQVIAKFGNPDMVQPITMNTGAAGGGGTGGGGGAPGPNSGGGGMSGGGGGGNSGTVSAPGGRGAGRGRGGGPSTGAGSMGPSDMIGDPFGPTPSRQGAPAAASQSMESNSGGGGELSLNPNAGGGGGGDTGATGTSERVTFTRWVYRRSSARYAFIMDKFNRVVQIEAVGMGDRNVRTARGIGFGSTFADVIRKYEAPDGYEIGGTTIIMKYLVRDKVAFRLSRLDPKKPHVVTGIVVAAGKR